MQPTPSLGAQRNSPLILDDVTVQSDQNRTRQILSMLKSLAEEHQIIFFTQEQEVLEWARENLTEEHDQVASITPVHAA